MRPTNPRENSATIRNVLKKDQVKGGYLDCSNSRNLRTSNLQYCIFLLPESFNFKERRQETHMPDKPKLEYNKMNMEVNQLVFIKLAAMQVTPTVCRAPKLL